MTINLLYYNEMEAHAISSILEMNGFQVKRPDLDCISTNSSHFKSIFIVDNKYLQKSSKKQLEILCDPQNYIVLVGNRSHLYWFFRINCSLSCFISKKEKIDELNFSIKKLTADKPFFSKHILSFLEKDRSQQHEILLMQNLSSYLTITELKTMSQIATGKKSKQIAEEWNRSHHTINNHRKNISKKLDLKGTFRLTKFCFDKKNEIQTLISLRKNKEKVDRILKNNQR